MTAIALRMLGSIRARLRRRLHRRVHRRFRQYTMIDEGEYGNNLSLAARVRDVPGCVVECGVWRGGMSAGLATVLGTDRHYYLCDSFAGLPPARPIDGESALRWQANTTGPRYHDNCAAEETFAIRAMAMAGIDSYSIVKGWFDDTLPRLSLDQPIALLRLDADWYDSTMTCLTTLYPRVAAGGLVVVDDYYTWDGCARAVHDYLSGTSSVERIRNEGGTCYIEKTAPTTSPTGPGR